MKARLLLQSVAHKVEYYQMWYRDLTLIEKKSWLGDWILERISLYSEAINSEVETLKQVA